VGEGYSPAGVGAAAALQDPAGSRGQLEVDLGAGNQGVVVIPHCDGHAHGFVQVVVAVVGADADIQGLRLGIGAAAGDVLVSRPGIHQAVAVTPRVVPHVICSGVENIPDLHIGETGLDALNQRSHPCHVRVGHGGAAHGAVSAVIGGAVNVGPRRHEFQGGPGAGETGTGVAGS